MAVATRLQNIEDLASFREHLLAGRKPKKTVISVCTGTGCRAHGSMALLDEFQRQIDVAGLAEVEVRASGCHGFCEKGPLVIIFPTQILYCGVQPKNVSAIIEKTICIQGGKPYCQGYEGQCGKSYCRHDIASHRSVFPIDRP